MTRFGYDFAIGGAFVAALLLAVTALAGPWGPAPCAPVGATQKADCPCSQACSCGCQAGKPCGPGCEWPGRQKAPQKAPQKAQETPPDWREAGVTADQVPEGPSYKINGIRVTREQCKKAIEAGITDDSTWLRVSVFSEDLAAAKAFLASPELTPFKGRVMFGAYRLSDPLIQGLGFKSGVYVQKPDGTVLHRQDSVGSPATLAAAIRKADPNYDPAKDPDLNKAAPSAPDLPFGLTTPTLGLLLAAAAVAYFLWSRKTNA